MEVPTSSEPAESRRLSRARRIFGRGGRRQPSRGGPRPAGQAVFALWFQPARDPIPPPPPIFDLLLAALFAWGGWRVWKKGRGWRSGALVLWLLALAGLYTYIRSF